MSQFNLLSSLNDKHDKNERLSVQTNDQASIKLDEIGEGLNYANTAHRSSSNEKARLSARRRSISQQNEQPPQTHKAGTKARQ